MYACAIIGCGTIAGGYDRKKPLRFALTHAGGYQLCSKTRLFAAADPDPTVLQAFGTHWNIDKLYPSYQDMLDREHIDILSICLPTHYHYEAFTLAYEKKIRAVFMEKPLSNDIAESRHMAGLSQDMLVSLNYFRRWNTALRTFREDLASGALGTLTSAVIRYTKGIFVNGSHVIDLARWFWGEPAHIQTIKIHGTAEDPGADFILTFSPDTAIYFLHVPNVEYVFVEIDILTTNGRFTIGQRGMEIIISRVEKDEHYSFNIMREASRQETAWNNCTTRAIEELTDCIEGKAASPACTPEDGIKAMEICSAVLSRKSIP